MPSERRIVALISGQADNVRLDILDTAEGFLHPKRIMAIDLEIT
jgi:hypothetical protein